MTQTNMWMIYLTVTILSVIQIHCAAGCTIQSATSPTASSLIVKWNPVSGATTYRLELRVINSTNIAAVIATVNSPSTQKRVYGLRPGNPYEVTLKALSFFTIITTCKFKSMTVPDIVQFTYAEALTSSTIRFEWDNIVGVVNYTLHGKQVPVSSSTFVQVFSSSSGEVNNLAPSTSYECYIIASNDAGSGAAGPTRTITTLIPPPANVSATSAEKSTVLVTWEARDGVLMYQVTVTDTDPSHDPVINKTSETSLIISNLEPCSNYTLGVSSLNAFSIPGEPNQVSHITSSINPVTTITKVYSCATATVTVTWDMVFGANSYRADVTDGNGESLNCTSTSNNCDISALKCGEKYTVHVTAISNDCHSTYTLPDKFDTVPCAPANPTTEYTCFKNTINYKWEPTNNTKFYMAQSTDQNGIVKPCMTKANYCYFTDMQCGNNYTFTVKAVSSDCNSEVTEPRSVQTGPCKPANIQTTVECTSGTLTTTWDAAAGAQSYKVRNLGNDKSYNCSTSNNSCIIEDVLCGEHFTVWVSATNEACTTEEVLGEVAQTGPCPPTNVSVLNDCSPDTGTVKWTQSKGVVFYIVIAEDSTGKEYSFFSLESELNMTDLACGTIYNVIVMGNNFKCNSSSTDSISFQTAPCPPTNVVGERNCTNNEALITWDHQATGSYTAIIEDKQNGDKLNCTSNNEKSCIISSPPCGKTYSVTVTYDFGNCSSASTAVTMDSVPCQPENLAANVTCITGELTATWTSPLPAEEYMTEIRGGNPLETVYCNSTETRCIQAGLDCGSSYTLTVYSLNGSCSSLPSAQISVQTIPCPPTSVQVQKKCSPNNSGVSWATSAGSAKYIAEAVSADGLTSQCESQQTTCSFPDLRCGQVYTISVSGMNESCAGQQSSNVSLRTEPCGPVNVSSQLDCQASTASVSWASTANAANYSVKATNTGSSVYCYGPNTSCSLSLDCNVQHTITVTASDEVCTSNTSTPFEQDPAPCAPQNVETSQTCGTNDVVVSWDAVSLSWQYNVTAVSSSGQVPDVSCSTGSSNCTLDELACGQNYTITVIAFSGSCIGPTSTPVKLTTAPCGVATLATELTCGSNTLNISVTAYSGATSYVVSVSGPNGFSKNCTTVSLACQISGLQCATQYNVSAVTEGSTCSSSPADTVVTTGPCDATNVNSALICSSDSAIVSWEVADGADAYTVKASEVGSLYETSCRNNTPSCQLDQLNCGKNYTLTVVSEGTMCNSTGTTASLTTAPCPPTIQYYNLTCGTNSSSLTWTPVPSATRYGVVAVANGDSVSCNSTTTECTLTQLKCSQNYTATVVAQGNECDSEPSAGFTMATAPCPPSLMSPQYNCSSSSASISWSAPGGSTGFSAEVFLSGGYTDSCDTSENSCEFTQIPCGLSLQINVKAKGPQCDSGDSISDTFETVPCAATNVNATLLCGQDSATVTWTENSSAVNYTVTARSQASVSYCYNVSTSCTVPDIQCGEDYNITVTTHSATCTGLTSDVYPFKAGLCAPTSASVSPECQNNIVNWSNVPGAEKVVATATNDNGQTYQCESSSSNSCNISDIPCGGNYSVSVVTVDRGCDTGSKSAGRLITVQCPPTNLNGDIDCGNNTMTLTWDQSSVAGTNYSIKRELIGSGAAPSVSMSSKNTYTMTDLQCGETYNFSVAANDGNCQTDYSPPIQRNTAPCEPANFTARVDCGSNNGTFSWSEGKGASSYTVLVTGENDHKANCSGSDMTCVIKLNCGRFYSASLVASTDTCSTTKSGNLVIESAPCLPENVEAVVDCSTNVMNVTWKQMPAPENYTAWAISSGHNASCTSESNFCPISDLECGQVYDVVVSASSIDCKVIAGSDYKVQSAPCKPESMSIDLNCSTNAVTVSWTQLNTNKNTTVTATSELGMTSCQSQDTSCLFTNLNCGTYYTFTAVAQTNVCMSENNTLADTTAPCAPSTVSAKQECGTKEAVVVWNSTGSAESYIVQAQSSEGQSFSCNSSGTTCNLQELLCGQVYTLSVEAVTTDCTGPASNTTTFVTEPCVPANVSATYTVGAAQMTWEGAKGASSFSVEAVTDSGTPTVSNTSTNTQCALTGLLCGKTYNITVTAFNDACDGGVTSEQIQQKTEPCPPTNVQANMECEKSNATVSWNLSDNAVGYTAFFLNENNHNASCQAANTESSCEVTGLECGTVYTVRAVAKGNPIDSSPSNETSVTTEPCQPSNINVTVDCEDKVATVSWQPSEGAQSYVTELRTSNHSDVCHSNNSSCQPSHLHCGEEYNVSVTAVGESCNSTGRMASNFYTEPCEVKGVSVNYTVGNALVQWNGAEGATSFSVEAVSDQGDSLGCNSSTTQCNVSGLQCSKLYNVTVSAYNQACDSQGVKSDPEPFITEPCPPSNVQATVACETMEATINWNQSNFAEGYVARINSTEGSSGYCSAARTDTSCVISHLVCGLVYSASVIATGNQYNSSESTAITFSSAPCYPKNISVQVNCSSDGEATLSWTADAGANVSVTSVVGGNPTTLCSTQKNSCVVTSLSCGQTYSLNVTATNDQCSVTASTRPSLNTRPCPPQNVNATLQCGSKTANVTWDQRPYDEEYTVSAIKQSDGAESYCNSTSANCEFNNLPCGETYNFTVKALSNGCYGQASSSVSTKTEPCVPANVSATYTVGVVQVTWGGAKGASSFSVEAVTDSGTPTVSNTSTNTQCALTGLLCGKTYNITVTAFNDACDGGVTSEQIQQKTEPCPPTNVQANMECEKSNATVSWNLSDNAVGYTAFFLNENNHNASCQAANTESSCEVTGLECGTVYTVRAVAKGNPIDSSPSNETSVTTEPCQPSNINVTVDCEDKVATVSWQPSEGAQSYVTELRTSNHSDVCHSNNSSCQPSHLHCGEEYNVSVTAVGESCNSTGRMASNFYTEPCEVKGVSVNYTVGNALVQWNGAEGATSFSVEAVSDQGDSLGCNSSTTQCNVSGLQCSKLYNVTVSAYNQACDSQGVKSDPEPFITEPCPPSNVQATVACETMEATINWNQSNFAEGYVARINSTEGSSGYCSAARTDTSCVISHLVCGLVYSASVIATGNQYNSSESTAITFSSAPCYPKNISVQVNCSSDGEATLSWTADAGANVSVTSVVGGNPTTLCSTQQNSCVVTSLSCGQTYSLNVTATNDQCSVTASTRPSLNTRPCPPQNVDATLQCGSKTANVTWDQRPYDEEYTVSAIKQSDGAESYCNSTSANCEFNNLPCGETYNFTVKALSNGCYGQASSSVSTKTEPCQPEILDANATCQSEDVQIFWKSASGAQDYIVKATGDLGFVQSFSTNETSYSASLMCGQNYSITLQSQGPMCDSPKSSPSYVKTTPCVPQNVVVEEQCTSNLVSWSPSNGTTGYNATATSLGGQVLICITNVTSCTWDNLQCGEQYNVTVQAYDDSCTSLPSDTAVIHMSPCVPQNLVPSVDCNSEVVSLTWSQCLNTLQYNVTAQADSEVVTITVSQTSASFPSLSCGKTYNLTVTPLNDECPATPATTTAQTWPCSVTGVSTSYDCLGTTTVTWQTSAGADNYTATMISDSGLSYNCTSQSTSCPVSQLPCGQNFSVSVTASNAACTVTSTEPIHQITAPCDPMNLQTVMNCAMDSAAVSWNASMGADNYTVTGQSSAHNVSCDTSGITCDLTNLACGTQYSIRVVARDIACSSAQTQAQTLDTAPCPPENVDAIIDCETNDLNVTWASSAQAQRYLVSVTAQSGGSNETCNTTNTFCTFSNVTCGNTFVAQVISVRDSCQSQPSLTASVVSKPCRPKVPDIDKSCRDAQVSWTLSPVADMYCVVAIGDDGHTHTCNTTFDNCTLSPLHCGQQYSVTVTASNENCSSLPSPEATLYTGPCKPENVSVAYDCRGPSALLTWNENNNAVGYYASAVDDNGNMLNCYNALPNCSFEGLQCERKYNFTVMATDGTCNSSYSDPVDSVGAVSCPPENITVQLLPQMDDNQILFVSWSSTSCGSTEYSVSLRGNLLGDDQFRFDMSSYWISELYFELPLPCSSEYNATVESMNSAGTSGPSVTVAGTTAPCPPSSGSFINSGSDVNVVWAASPLANTYTVYEISTLPRAALCTKNAPNCTISNHVPVNLVVTASNEGGESVETSITDAI